MKEDPRVTHKFVKFIGKNPPHRDRLTPGLKHTFEEVGEVIAVTPAQHASMMRRGSLYADATEAEFEAYHGGAHEPDEVTEDVTEGTTVGDRSEAFVVPSAELFCKRTANEIRTMDYTHIPVDVIEKYLDHEIGDKGRSSVMGFLENLLNEKREGSYRFGGDGDE